MWDAYGYILVIADQVLIVKPELQAGTVRHTPKTENEILDIEILVFR
jgi:hypothetical protein